MTDRGDDFWLSKFEKLTDQVAESNARLHSIHTLLEERGKELARLNREVELNVEFRQKSIGSLKLAMVVLSLVGASIIGTGGWMIRTTLLLEERGAQTSQRMDALGNEVSSLERLVRRIGDGS